MVIPPNKSDSSSSTINSKKSSQKEYNECFKFEIPNNKNIYIHNSMTKQNYVNRTQCPSL